MIKTINYMTNGDQFNYKDYYYGAFFADENRYEEYKNVLNYIESQNEEVVVISYKAALYMIPLEKSNGAIDLPFYGNMGTNGESNMIKHIGNMYNTKILILRDINEIHGQESKKINQYIRDNFNYISSIEEFDIFEKRVLTINNKL